MENDEIYESTPGLHSDDDEDDESPINDTQPCVDSSPHVDSSPYVDQSPHVDREGILNTSDTIGPDEFISRDSYDTCNAVFRAILTPMHERSRDRDIIASVRTLYASYESDAVKWALTNSAADELTRIINESARAIIEIMTYKLTLLDAYLLVTAINGHVLDDHNASIDRRAPNSEVVRTFLNCAGIHAYSAVSFYIALNVAAPPIYVPRECDINITFLHKFRISGKFTPQRRITAWIPLKNIEDIAPYIDFNAIVRYGEVSKSQYNTSVFGRYLRAWKCEKSSPVQTMCDIIRNHGVVIVQAHTEIYVPPAQQDIFVNSAHFGEIERWLRAVQHYRKHCVCGPIVHALKSRGYDVSHMRSIADCFEVAFNDVYALQKHGERLTRGEPSNMGTQQGAKKRNVIEIDDTLDDVLGPPKHRKIDE